MSGLRLTKTAIREGVWRGELRGVSGGACEVPEVVVSHLNAPLDGVKVSSQGEGAFALEVPIPAELLSDGVQCFVITDAESDERLGHFTIITGHPADDDMRAEIELLRAELDMLKSAFRRHCLETA